MSDRKKSGGAPVIVQSRHLLDRRALLSWRVRNMAAERPTVYIETTVVSYLTAWSSRDLIRSAQQQITREWWRDRRPGFELLTSQLVIEEASAGDATAAAERLAVLQTLRSLDVTDAALDIADALVRDAGIPAGALRDAIHVGICAANGVDYLLTWNFRHLANAFLKGKISEVCQALGYRPSVICTPEELFEVPS